MCYEQTPAPDHCFLLCLQINIKKLLHVREQREEGITFPLGVGMGTRKEFEEGLRCVLKEGQGFRKQRQGNGVNTHTEEREREEERERDYLSTD